MCYYRSILRQDSHRVYLCSFELCAKISMIRERALVENSNNTLLFNFLIAELLKSTH